MQFNHEESFNEVTKWFEASWDMENENFFAIDKSRLETFLYFNNYEPKTTLEYWKKHGWLTTDTDRNKSILKKVRIGNQIRWMVCISKKTIVI